MMKQPVWTSASPRERGPLDPAIIRAIVRMWELHRTGNTWMEVGRALGMPGGDLEIAFNRLVDRGLQARQDELYPIDQAYMNHYEHCKDCDGPSPTSIGGTRAPGS